MLEIIEAVVSSKPKILGHDVNAEGDVEFSISINDISLDAEDCANPAMKTRFMVNFIGELLVRENLKRFACILTGIDSALYKKIVCCSKHTNFGMVIDRKCSVMIFTMHISLVEEIMIEKMGNLTPSFVYTDPKNTVSDFQINQESNNSSSSEE